MEPEVRKAPIRFYELDLLRFVAALSVVFYHYTYRGYAADNFTPIPFLSLGRITRYGYLGVELFFLISGYVVLLSAQGKTVRQFFLSRVTRLYPAFWVACTITFVVKFIWGSGLPSTYLQAGFKQYLYNLTMLHEFFGVPAIDEAYWSLTVELGFYFIVALLIGFSLMRHLDIFIGLWLGYTALVGPAVTGTKFDALFFPQWAPFFAAGMLFYLLQQPQGRTWQRYAMLVVAFRLAIRTAIYRADGQMSSLHGAVSGKVAVVIVGVFFLIFFVMSFRLINLSRFTWLAKIGALTYPLYLVHSDIAFIFFHRVGYQYNKYALLGGTLAFMLVLAYAIHRFVEKPLGKWLGTELNKRMARQDEKSLAN
jgi:peptidoglycan/LPS O-acetylase OafA/YrhL